MSSDLSTALETDALLSSHPIEVAIKDPREIKQVFDALSYRKGASVVRQLEAALGEVLFKKVSSLSLLFKEKIKERLMGVDF